MKFSKPVDVQMFLVEVGRTDLLNKIEPNYKPSEDLEELFIKGRKKKVKRLKDFKKSQMTASQWRKDKFKMMRGIKDFHSSTKGKQMHRSIGRFLATRDMRGGIFARESNGNLAEVSNILKELSALRTHGYIGLEYYKTLSEQADYEIFLEEMVPVVERIEHSLIVGKEIKKPDLDFLVRLTEQKVLLDEVSRNTKSSFEVLEVFWREWGSIGESHEPGFYLDLLNDSKRLNETAALIKSFADKSGKSVAEVENAWNSIKGSLIKSGKKKDDPLFFKLLVGGLKKALKLV